jgi:hypothetical protein
MNDKYMKIKDAITVYFKVLFRTDKIEPWKGQDCL